MKNISTKNIKFFLVFIIGLLFGATLHGIIEILAIWILLDGLKDFFFAVSWNAWYWIHIISMVIVEIISLLLVFWVYLKYEK